MTALMDTGFILALINTDDRLHIRCLKAFTQELNPLVPSVVLPELSYMVIRNAGYTPLITFVRSVLAGKPPLIIVTEQDFSRAMEIMEKYINNRIDFVDCVIAAMAERLNISRILTVDQRDFRMFRPKHVPVFDILP